jgi:hypothetical protein
MIFLFKIVLFKINTLHYNKTNKNTLKRNKTNTRHYIKKKLKKKHFDTTL